MDSEALRSQSDPSSASGHAERATAPRREGLPKTVLFVVSDRSGEKMAATTSIDHDEVGIHDLSADLVETGARTLQGMAAALVRSIRSAQPLGPYRLAGLGLGGLVAYEAATQLLGEDEEVAFLGLVETDCATWADRRARSRTSSHSVTQAADDLDHVGGSTALREAALVYEVPSSPLAVHLIATRDARCLELARGWSGVLPREQIRTCATGAPETSTDRHLFAVRAALSQCKERVDKGRTSSADGRSQLVTIQAGSRHSPIFVGVPGAGASVTDFVPLASALGVNVAVHSFQARGMDGVLLPHSTVSAAARAYLRELDHLGTSAGIHLVGHSFGGWVAFEMALQLRAAGRNVASLTLLDSEYPCATDVVEREYTRSEALMELVLLYEQAAERPLGIGIADLEELEAEAQLAHLHRRLVQNGLMPSRSVPGALRGPVRSFEAALRTRYRPKNVFTGSTKLLLVPEVGEASGAAESRFDDEVRGWRALAPNLQFRRGEGNHITLLQPPHVGPVARWMREGS